MNMKAIDIIRKNPIYKHDPKVFQKFKGKKVWVTGICGSIGWSLAQKLMPYATVGGIDCNEEKIAKILANHKKLWGQVIPGMYWDVLPRDWDYIFHCAAFKHVRLAAFNREGYDANNYSWVSTLLARLKASESKSTFVLCSTDKACGESWMGKSKKEAEDSAHYHGKHSLRLVNVAYSHGSVLANWSAGKHKVCNKDVSRYWMQMSDAVYALCACALEKPGKYTVQNCPKITMGEMKKAWDKEFGPKRWKDFEMVDEAYDEKLISENEKMETVNEVLARIV
jgi:FlaA1/EpsC-like NDP-sugar epimerase